MMALTRDFKDRTLRERRRADLLVVAEIIHDDVDPELAANGSSPLQHAA
jgi:hypothetical protein